MDLCGMKYFNRKYSFAEGDNLLRSFADILKLYFGNENCSRFGSDHFCVITDAVLPYYVRWQTCEGLSQGGAY